jgi:hypothetical protein
VEGRRTTARLHASVTPRRRGGGVCSGIPRNQSRWKQNLKGKAGYLDIELQERCDAFQKKRQHNRSASFGIKLLATILAASTTVLVGLQNPDSGPADGATYWFRLAALVSSAVVTVLGACKAFFDYRGLWIRYTEARSRLLALRARLLYMASGDKPLGDRTLDELFNTYEAVLDDLNEGWLAMHRPSPPAIQQRPTPGEGSPTQDPAPGLPREQGGEQT